MDKNTLETFNFIGKPRILIAPLDWGLGHATRCIPIIYALLERGYPVIIAADGPSKILLQKEFSNIEYLPLKGYHIIYSKKKFFLPFSMLFQLPKIMKAIISENRWLKKTVQEKSIDIVISDNRFGLYNKNAHCIFITHQLLIRSPLLQGVLQKINYSFINRFNECWVPDFSDEPSLAGVLSHPKKMPLTRVRYIGWLSRFQKGIEEEEKHILILLSGPEPQRTLLEIKIIAQLKGFQEQVLIVRGLPGSEINLETSGNLKYVNHLPANELQKAIQSASFVIARSGYSTVMDLLKMKKKTILIPTPGQTEQEYLAKYLLKQQLTYSVPQDKFDLHKAIDAAAKFRYSFFESNAESLLQEALSFKDFSRRFQPL